jgi:hypothetical protein
MNSNGHEHLTYDELLTAVVDMQDLAPARKTHLSICPTCRREHDHLLNRLGHIGRMARNLAPEPARPFRLPEKGVLSRHKFSKPVWIAGFAAAMLLALVFWRPQWRVESNLPQMTTAALLKDQQLMQSVDALVDDALPKPYQQLASADDTGAAVDEAMDAGDGDDFPNWIVPPITDNTDESLS